MSYATATITASRDERYEVIDLDGMTSLSDLANKLWDEFPLGVHDGGEFDPDPDTDQMPDHVTLTDPEGFAKHLFVVCSPTDRTIYAVPVINFDELLETWSREDDDDRREAMGEYLDDMGADDLSDFDEAYQGQWNNGADFAESLCLDSGDVPSNFPSWICIEWEATWNCNLRHDYHITNSGHVFRNL